MCVGSEHGSLTLGQQESESQLSQAGAAPTCKASPGTLPANLISLCARVGVSVSVCTPARSGAHTPACMPRSCGVSRLLPSHSPAICAGSIRPPGLGRSPGSWSREDRHLPQGPLEGRGLAALAFYPGSPLTAPICHALNSAKSPLDTALSVGTTQGSSLRSATAALPVKGLQKETLTLD